MIATILIMGLAFYWLLLETHWLSINLRYALEQAVELEYQDWETVSDNIGALPIKHRPFWFKHPENMQPLMLYRTPRLNCISGTAIAKHSA